jgi:hypothetical protein
MWPSRQHYPPVPPPPLWWRAGFCRPPRAPPPDPVLEAKWDKRLAALPRPWPGWGLPCGEGGYCYDRRVPPYFWRG